MRKLFTILILITQFTFPTTLLSSTPKLHVLPECLVDNVYHEARGETLSGMIAVAIVTLNRAKKDSICKQVYLRKQFSWTSAKVKEKTERELRKVRHAVTIAISGGAKYYIPRTLLAATHYHTFEVKPFWSKKLDKLGTLGRHIFYKQR